MGGDRESVSSRCSEGRHIVSTNFGAGDPGIPGRNSQDPLGTPAPQPGSPQSQIPRDDENAEEAPMADPFTGSAGSTGAGSTGAGSTGAGSTGSPFTPPPATSGVPGTSGASSAGTSGSRMGSGAGAASTTSGSAGSGSTGASGTGHGSSASGGGVSGAADTAKSEAADVASHAGEAGKKVAGTAKDEATHVVKEAGNQAKDLFEQARTQAVSQASEQQGRVASGLRSISDEFAQMGEGREDSGFAGQLVQMAGTRASAVASWLEDREPGDLLDEVKEFARRKPGVFIAAAAIAGIAAGRITKAVMSADSHDEPSTTPRATQAPSSTTVRPPSTSTVTPPPVTGTGVTGTGVTGSGLPGSTTGGVVGGPTTPGT